MRWRGIDDGLSAGSNTTDPRLTPRELEEIAAVVDRAERLGVDPRRVLSALGVDPRTINPPANPED